MDAGPMINKCFRHQHPEAFGHEEVVEPSVPLELRYGRETAMTPRGETLSEDDHGIEGAHRLDGDQVVPAAEHWFD